MSNRCPFCCTEGDPHLPIILMQIGESLLSFQANQSGLFIYVLVQGVWSKRWRHCRLQRGCRLEAELGCPQSWQAWRRDWTLPASSRCPACLFLSASSSLFVVHHGIGPHCSKSTLLFMRALGHYIILSKEGTLLIQYSQCEERDLCAGVHCAERTCGGIVKIAGCVEAG